MTRFLLILLLPLSCFAQFGLLSHDQPYLAQEFSKQGTGVAGLWYWWVSDDLGVGATVTNQYLDRIQQWPSIGYGSPTNSLKGVWFDGSSMYLSNGAPLNTLTANGYVMFAAVTPYASDTALGAILCDGQGAYGIYTSGSSSLKKWAGGNTIGAFSAGTEVTVAMVVQTNGTDTTYYTNGVASISDANEGFNFYYCGRDGAATPNYFKGYIRELQVYTNSLTAANITTIQNEYKSRNP